MRRILILLLFFLSFGFGVFAEDPTPRTAACDLCGYCPPNNPPQSWSSCLKCIYPNITPDPATKESLKIEPTINLPPTPYPGHQYTFLGCLGGSTGFTVGEGSSAGPVVQSILKIVFSIVGGIAFLYLLYGSFIIATSQSDPERLNYGRRLITGAIIGLVFALSSVLIMNFIATNILKVPGFGETPTPTPT